MKKKVLPTSDETFNAVERRVVLVRDNCHEWCRTWSDHSFVLWSNCCQYSGDANAESPFVENDDGENVIREGVIAFPVSVYDHSGLFYSLGSGAGLPDARWDVTSGALWLWTDRAHYDLMAGDGEFDRLNREQLREIASEQVKEMNLDERGAWYGFRVERRAPYVKTYADGHTVSGVDWEEEDSCYGYLTDEVDDIDFPADLPVFAEKDTYLVGQEYEAA